MSCVPYLETHPRGYPLNADVIIKCRSESLKNEMKATYLSRDYICYRDEMMTYFYPYESEILHTKIFTIGFTDKTKISERAKRYLNNLRNV